VPFVIRREFQGSGYPRYLAVDPGIGNHVNPRSLRWEPEVTKATRFFTREEAEQCMATVGGGSGTSEIEEVD
jgi:hypothetical protein